MRVSIDQRACLIWKTFCPSKETIIRMKRHPSEWEKIFDSYSSDKELICRTYKEFQKVNANE
jgi:hypothetical protein